MREFARWQKVVWEVVRAQVERRHVKAFPIVTISW